MKTKNVILFIGIMLINVCVFSQETKKMSDFEKTIRLDKSTDTKEFIIEINNRCKTFNLQIESYTYDGELLVEILNPKKNKEGEISNNSKNNLTKEYKEDKFLKQIIYPEEGTWKIIINSKEFTGNIKIKYQLLD